jgi:hypothetical protein
LEHPALTWALANHDARACDPAETAMLYELARNLDEIDALVTLLADQLLIVTGSTGHPRAPRCGPS